MSDTKLPPAASEDSLYSNEPQSPQPFEALRKIYDLFLGNTRKFISAFVIILLAVMSVLIVYQVVCRYFLSSPSNFTDELLRFSLIWLGIMGAVVCFINESHLSLPIILDKMTKPHQDQAHIFNAIMNITLGIVLCIGGYLAVEKNYIIHTALLGWSVGILQSVLVIAGVIIVVDQIFKVALRMTNKTNVLTCIASIAVVLLITFLIGYVKDSDTLVDFLYEHLELCSGLLLFISFAWFLFLGTPIAVGLAISGLLTLSLQIDSMDLTATTGEKFFSGLDSFGFLALPFFILAGNIMNQGGIAHKLINFAMLLGRKIPGSLFQANSVANMLFGSLSGSAIAASTAIGGIVAPLQKEQKYDLNFSAAVNAASSMTGFLIPPTGCFIVYSLITGGAASIAALFIAGYIPGIIMGVSVMAVAFYYAKKHGYKTDSSKISMSYALKTTLEALPSLFLIVLVIGGIVLGVFTAIEASGIAVAYSFILALCYRSISFKSFIKILYSSAMSSAVILFLIACSGLMSWSMTFANIPDSIGEFLIALTDNKYLILLLINITLLAVGLFMDMSPAMLIFTPIFYPVVTALGIDPIHFGVILVYNLSLGVITPPVGTVLFISANVANIKVTGMIKPLMPIFIMQLIGLILVTYIPALSLALPEYLGVL